MSAAVDVGRLSSPIPRVVRLWQALALAGFAVLAAHLGAGLGGHALDNVVDRWLCDGLEVVAAAGCLLRAVSIGSERSAWAVLGLGMLSFSIGDICFDFVYGGSPPTPSLADAFYLGFYPGCYAGLVLLVKSRISSFNRGIWLDGAIAALASASVSAAVVLEVVLRNTTGSTSLVVVDLAYPVADLILIALVVFVFAITGWRPGRAWAIVGSAFLVITVADGLFLYLSATGGYTEGTLLDALWPAAMLLLAASAWENARHERTIELEGRFLSATPLVCGVVALGVLVEDRFDHHNLVADVLAAGGILMVFIRMALSFFDNTRLLHQARSQSMTDYLTGLGNRRRLMVDLERQLRKAQPDEALLVVFDLNGFKRYNDTFGHPGGDALLVRLAGKLARASEPAGAAYRLGGDEFCVLASSADGGAERLIDATVAALSEEGEGFSITAAFGAIVLPEEANDPIDALRLADQRLYAQKHNLYQGQGESYEVLVRALSESEPSLREHMRGVADLAAAVGARLGVSGFALRELLLAAELHDVGKLAIPDAVLEKPGALSEEEWEFIRQHTVIGQRILAGAPALRDVGRIVRATHERWDGAGYVDGLSAASIPLPARVIAVCDAYAAMTSDRPYRASMSSDDAIAELKRCAGAQFDPEVVRMFCALYEETGGLGMAAALEPESGSTDACRP